MTLFTTFNKLKVSVNEKGLHLVRTPIFYLKNLYEVAHHEGQGCFYD